MSYTAIYTRINWVNRETALVTPIDEINLNKMDYALKVFDDRTVEMDIKKADQSTVLNLISDWTMNEETGIITITKLNGEKIMFDMNVEKIPVNFSMSNTGVISMITEDGTEFSADISKMIPVLTFENSETIIVTVEGEGVDKTYSFDIKDGSITSEKLQPDYLADVTVASNNATTSANVAKNSAEQALISETNSKASEIAAKNSEQAAKVSETNAAESETKASKTLEDAERLITNVVEEYETYLDGKVEDIISDVLTRTLDDKVVGSLDLVLGTRLDDIQNVTDTNAENIAALEERTTTKIITIGNELSRWGEYMIEGPIGQEWSEFLDITYGNDLYVAVGNNGKMYYSEDCTGWTATSKTIGTGLKAITYGNGKFVAVGGIGSVYSIYYSTDGINWECKPYDANFTLSFALNDVICANGMFVAVGNNGATAYSLDGITWSTGSSTSGTMNTVAYGNGKFVAISDSGYTYWYSEDGKNWSTDEAEIGTVPVCATYGNGYFTGISAGGCIYKSEDGITWKYYDDITYESGYSGLIIIKDIAYGNGYFVVVGYLSTDNSPVVYTCTDPGNKYWPRVECWANGPLNSIISHEDKFITVGGENGSPTISMASFPITTKRLSSEIKIVKSVLLASKTVITLSNELITEDSLLSFYTSIFGVNPTNVSVSAGSVTLTFEPQEVDMEVGVRVDG